MGRTRTLADLVADVRWAADSEGQDDVTGRHTRAAIVRAINQAQHELRFTLAEAGERTWIATGSVVLASGSQSVDIGASYPNVLRIYSVTACRGTDYKYWTVRAASWEEMMRMRAIDLTGPPEVWSLVRVTTTHNLVCYPLADASYTLQFDYLPRATDLEADGDTLDGIAGFEDFVVYDAAARLVIRDGNSDGRLALLQGERERYAARIRRHNERGEVHSKVRDQRDQRARAARRRGGGQW